MDDKRKPMEARDRAVWEDAEGSLWVPAAGSRKSGPHLRTSQTEKGILLDYQVGALSDGISCGCYTRNAKKTAKTPRAYTFYETQISGNLNVALELCLTAPFRRSIKFASQIDRFKAFLALPRMRTYDTLIRARELCKFF
jgi:hypothetical protein